MVSGVKWSINFAILSLLIVALGVIYHQSAQQKGVALNCSSELFDHHTQGQADAKHYLLVDLFTTNGNAQVNYRYFNLDGSSAGSILMRGKVDKVDMNSQTYRISVHTKEEVAGQVSDTIPEHMKYLSYISTLHLNEQGMHNLSVELLDIDQTKDYAVVLFQPSNTVCGCRIMH